MRRVGTGIGFSVGQGAQPGARRPEAMGAIGRPKLSASTKHLVEGDAQRVRWRYVRGLMASLSGRDWAVLETVDRLRLATGQQLERLHFMHLIGRSRQVMRWRVLKVLVNRRVLRTLPRRVATGRSSAAHCYAMDAGGVRLMQLRANRAGGAGRIRPPGQPGDRFIDHVLAVTELYVLLVERIRSQAVELRSFLAEPAAWHPDGLGGQLKPDAYLVLRAGGTTDYWWCEVDRATESLPTVRRKLLAYLDFLGRGQLGPDQLMPRVVVTAPTLARRDAIAAVVQSLPPPAAELFRVTTLEAAPDLLIAELIDERTSS